jgi:Transposase DDE domain
MGMKKKLADVSIRRYIYRLMSSTPFFPSWRARLAPLGGRATKTLADLSSSTLSQLEGRLAAWIPPDLFPKAARHQNSRDRLYTQWRTFWCMLWQSLNPQASGREVVRQLQALFKIQGGPSISQEDGAYCRARARLPLAQFPKALAATAQAADQLAGPVAWLQNRPVKLLDGSTLTLPDTPKNRSAYPPIQTPQPHFPMMRIVVLFSLLGGAIMALAQGNLHTCELSLFGLLMGQLATQDIVVGDRGFGNFVVVALLHQRGIDFIGRSARHCDGRRPTKRLGKDDWLMTWKKGAQPSPWLTSSQWTGLPAELTVRMLRGSCYQKGFRVRQVTLVTTLLDAQLYPAQHILQAYLRRWRLEMCLDDLKTTLKLEMLRSHSPEMAQKEVYARLLGHNLVRCVMAQAASRHPVALTRISFKGTLDGLRQFSQAMSQARSKRKRQELWSELLRTLAADLVPERPQRREPRAVKRKKNKYPRLTAPRPKFRDRPKRHVRRSRARLRKLGLM